MLTKGSCTQCGACCSVIIVDFSKEEMRHRLKHASVEELRSSHMEDVRLVAHDWIELTRDQAIYRNPYFVRMTQADSSYHFYTCRNYDEKNRKCRIHDERPPICSEYPWYGKVEQDRVLPSAECGYHIDQERFKIIDLLKERVRAKRERRGLLRKAQDALMHRGGV